MAKKKAEPRLPKVKRYPVRIIDETFTVVTRKKNPDDEWDSDDLSHNTKVIEVVPGLGYPDVSPPFPLEAEKEYYLVYVTYGTGDSFHHEDGRVDYIDLFATLERAEACVNAIVKHDNEYGRLNKHKGYDPYTVYYLDEAGIQVKAHTYWHGYFESFQGADIATVSSRCNQDD